MSVGDESDVVTIPNMLVLVRIYDKVFSPPCKAFEKNFNTTVFHSHFQGASVMMENMPFPIRVLLSATFKTFNEGPFLTKPVGELMWGYDSKLVDFLNKYLPGMLPSSGKFGLFAEVGVFCAFSCLDTVAGLLASADFSCCVSLPM